MNCQKWKSLKNGVWESLKNKTFFFGGGQDFNQK